jgi:hypothetical protein
MRQDMEAIQQKTLTPSSNIEPIPAGVISPAKVQKDAPPSFDLSPERTLKVKGALDRIDDNALNRINDANINEDPLSTPSRRRPSLISIDTTKSVGVEVTGPVSLPDQSSSATKGEVVQSTVKVDGTNFFLCSCLFYFQYPSSL